MAAIALLFSGTVLLPDASASQVRGAELDELVEHAELIVAARVLTQRAEWNDGKIRTITTLTPHFTWKGEPDATFEIVTPGGRIGDIATRVPGTEALRLGSTKVLFLQPLGTEQDGGERLRYRTVAMAWSSLEVVEIDGSTFLVLDTLASSAHVDAGSRGAPDPDPFSPDPSAPDPSEATRTPSPLEDVHGERNAGRADEGYRRAEPYGDEVVPDREAERPSSGEGRAEAGVIDPGHPLPDVLSLDALDTVLRELITEGDTP